MPSESRPTPAAVAAGLVELALNKMTPLKDAMGSVDRMAEIALLLEGASAVLAAIPPADVEDTSGGRNQ